MITIMCFIQNVNLFKKNTKVLQLNRISPANTFIIIINFLKK